MPHLPFRYILGKRVANNINGKVTSSVIPSYCKRCGKTIKAANVQHDICTRCKIK